MDPPEGAGSQRANRVDFDPWVRLEFRGTQLSSDGGRLVIRELDDAPGLSGLASSALCDSRRGKNTLHFTRIDSFSKSVNNALIKNKNVGLGRVCIRLAEGFLRK